MDDRVKLGEGSVLERLHALLDRFLGAMVDLRDDLLAAIAQAIERHADHAHVALLREFHGFVLGWINVLHEDGGFTVESCGQYHQYVARLRATFPVSAAA